MRLTMSDRKTIIKAWASQYRKAAIESRIRRTESGATKTRDRPTARKIVQNCGKPTALQNINYNS